MPLKGSRDGQSLIETCAALALICLIFTALLQIADLFAAREVLKHAAARGVRAKTVGFNWWMVEKTIRVASIPNAGKMIVPDYDAARPALSAMLADQTAGHLERTWSFALAATPTAPQYSMERARIPLYLGSENDARAHNILDYKGWDGIHSMHGLPFIPPSDTEVLPTMVNVRVEQKYNLWSNNLHQAFIAADFINLSAEDSMECHYDLYLQESP
jgi:hypothetical protein